ncbi:hypothetical protein PC9H_009309 [Pleurotus ostreatus]|uniref:Uncharacterized protein n=1 Tax=Pleurotus ostreatus TaxID=5322 RepID=A0A8H6ZPE9_PLEOS|nr:uncharacterized protein PC9H_009309 [Pleurotus ostreatus]KAF7424009.1 hypothetical protein PC9H_009309 [Pleurotus ostreatus]
MSTSDNVNTSRFKFRLQSPTPILSTSFRKSQPKDSAPSGSNTSKDKGKGREKDRDKDKDGSLVCQATRDTIHQVLLTYCPGEDGLEAIADILAQMYELMHEKDFTVFATSTLENKMSKAERKKTKPLHLVAIMLAELKDGTDPVAPSVFVPSSISQKSSGGRKVTVEEVDEEEEEEEEEEEDEGDSSAKNETSTQSPLKPPSGRHGLGARPPVSVHMKIEGLSAPLANKPLEKPGRSSPEPLSTSPLSTVNAEVRSRHRGVDWKAVTSDHTTPIRKHRIRFVTVYCHELHKVKTLPNPGVLVPAVWTSMNGDILILYNVRSAQAIKGADPHRVWYFEDGWKNITKAWNEGLDEAHIAHPDQVGMCDYFLTKNAGKPSWIQSASQRAKIRRNTSKE